MSLATNYGLEWSVSFVRERSGTGTVYGRQAQTAVNIKAYPVPTELERQKEAFLRIPPLLLAPYQGQFVVSHDGEIVDSDLDLPTLTARFFGAHQNTPVYITKVGQSAPEVVVTPF